MTMSPIVWGASLACALGGALAGNALGSTPMLDRPAIGSFYQSHEDGAAGRAVEGERPPDHYPLVTRSGTVPVAELGMRGLYSQARYRATIYAADYEPVEFAAADYDPAEDHARYHTADESVGIGDAAREIQPAPAPAAPAPLQLAAGPASVEGQGTAKLIDVRATLAMR